MSTRITLIQPSLTSYRVPIYRELAKCREIELNVVYGEAPGIPNVSPDGFVAQYRSMRRVTVGPGHFLWHSAQIEFASKQHCDVLILSWDAHYLSLYPSLLRARLKGVPTVLWGHGYSKRETVLRSMIRQIPARMADQLLFYSHGPADNYCRSLGYTENRVTVAPNAIDQGPIQEASRKWRGNKERLDRFQQKHGLRGRQVILFCSRFDPANRLDLLINATHLLVKHIPEVLVVIIGFGDKEKLKLEKQVAALQLQEHVTFLGGFYGEEKLAPWFLSAKVYCYPENIGLSLLHAFGYGLPVVTCDRSEVQNPEIEAFGDGVNGLTYRQGEYNQLAIVLKKLLLDENLRKKMSEESLKTVLTSYSLKAMVEGFEQAIAKGLERKY